MTPIRILTNFERFPETWSLPSGESGTAKKLKGFEGFRDNLTSGDLVLLNGDVSLTYSLAGYFLRTPSKRRPFVAADLVLRRPLTLSGSLTLPFKRLLLRQVDHFIHYFEQSEGYRQVYGITPEKSTFVPFKPNLRYRFDPKTSTDGEYVLCFGRSQRDYEIFFDATAGLPYPAAIPSPNFDSLREHGSLFTRPMDQVPKTVRMLDDDGSQESMIRVLEGAQ